MNIKTVVIIMEIAICSFFIYFDIFIPTLLVLPIVAVSLLLRKQPIALLGFKKIENFWKTTAKIFGLSIIWTIATLGLTIPLLMHLTGEMQNLSQFVNIKGNNSQLVIFLVASWTLAAVGEEIVYRGFLYQKFLELFGNNKKKYWLSVIMTSILFGFAHSEQATIGILITLVDSIYFFWIKRKFGNNTWASVLAHGFNNTIGVVGFYFLGPVYSLW